MINFKNGDVVLVDFDPSVGHEYKKIHPALIIQSKLTINKTALITVVPITSQTLNCQKYDIKVLKTKENALYSDSIIKVSCIHSFDKKRLLKKIGYVSELVKNKMKNYIKIHFDV